MDLIVFNIFKTDLNGGTECTLDKLAEGGEVVAPKERVTIETSVGWKSGWKGII